MMPQQRRALSVQKKRNILKKVDKHVGSRVLLARDLGIPITTLATIIKNRESIENSAIKCGPMARKRMYIRASKYDEMEEILKEWIVSARSSNMPINGPIIRDRALHIASRLNIEGFTASNGWFDRFKKRHAVVYRTACGKSRSVDTEISDDWKQTDIPALIADYAPKDIFSADETGLFFNILPSKTFSLKGESCQEGKFSEIRLTVLLITNSDGSEKLPPLIIGKAQNPQYFKDIKSLPAKYAVNEYAWMTSNIFEKQLLSLDTLMGVYKRKIILFLDKCSAHPSNLKLNNIKLAFFPPNCISELQPLNLGIIRAFKYFYRKNLVQILLSKIERGEDPKKFKVSILDAIYYIVKAWGEIDERTIKICFRKAGISTEQEDEIEDLMEHNAIDGWELFSDEPLQNYVDLDFNVITSEIVKIDDVVNMDRDYNVIKSEIVKNEDTVDNHIQKRLCDDELSSEDEINKTPTKYDAIRYIEGLKNYFASIEDVQDETFKSIYRIEKALYEPKNICRTDPHDFFSKN